MLKPPRLAAPACAAFLLLAGTASAAPLSGGFDDPAGDVGVPEQDIVAAAVVYDDTGFVRGAVSTTAPATEQTTPVIAVKVGKASTASGICNIKLDAALYPDAEETFGALTLGSQDIGQQAVFQSGSVLQFDTQDGDGIDPPRGPLPALAGQGWNCAVVASYSSKLVRGDYSDADDTGVFPLTAPRSDGQSPICRVVSKRVRRGNKLRVNCAYVTGAVTLKLHRRGKPRSARMAQLAPDGDASAKVRKRLKRGEYLAAVWQGQTLLGSKFVRIR